ncbi:MAG: hypothetical protein OQK71_03175 [Desulfobacter sp.]|nr:hypothetical protein [Desulfobacter sp.]
MKYGISVLVLLATIMAFTFGAYAAEPLVVADGASVAVATVVSVDEKTRVVSLAGPEGDHWTFTAGPEVQNFAQIKRGDRVIASYYQGFAIGIGPVGSGVKDRLDAVEVDRAQKGEKPGVRLSKAIAAVGVVKSVNTKDRTVVLEGVKNTLALEVSEDVDISEIKVGGKVEAVYIESYAVNLVPAPKVSATVTLESTSVAIGIGVTWGHGVMTLHDGTTHKLKVNGLSVVDLGISKISATGEVFNLVEPKDLNGTFITGEAGITIIGGGSASAMKNSNGVVMQLKSSQKGLKLTVAPGGMEIKLAE